MRFMPLPRDTGLKSGHVRLPGRITGAGSAADAVLWTDVAEAFAAHRIVQKIPVAHPQKQVKTR